jgi:hypothetical protein
MDWDVMLFIFLWAYWTAYKMTTQYTPFELVYKTQPIISTNLLYQLKEFVTYFKKTWTKLSM